MIVRVASAWLVAAIPAAASASSIVGYPEQCVPYAQAALGAKILGDAWTWRDKAVGSLLANLGPQ